VDIFSGNMSTTLTSQQTNYQILAQAVFSENLALDRMHATDL